MCQNHTRISAPCRSALKDALEDQEKLQELCRSTAKAQTPATDLSASSSTAATHPGAGISDVGVAALACETPKSAPSHGINRPSAELVGSVYPPEELQANSLSPAADKILAKACRDRKIAETDRADMRKELDAVAELAESVQVATVKKFLSPGLHDMRRITDKGAWLMRCLKFCQRTSSNVDQPESSTNLVSALAEQALLPDVLPQEHWDHFLVLTVDIQECVVHAVRNSLLANVTTRVSQHFENICFNERAIYIKQLSKRPDGIPQPDQVEWDEVDGRSYQKLQQRFAFKEKIEEKIMFELTEVDTKVGPGELCSLFSDHLATMEARRAGTAEVLSLMHAAANYGLVRVVARFIAEGFDVNERTGHSDVSPLHLAAASGEMKVMSLLLAQQADPNIRDGDGHTPLYVAIQAAINLRREQPDSYTLVPTHHALQVATVKILLKAGAESTLEGGLFASEPPKSPETFAFDGELYDIYNLIRLHKRVREFRSRFPTVDDVTVDEVMKLQYETGCFCLGLLERQTTVTPNAVPTEFRALVLSEHVQTRDEIQIRGNRLHKRFPTLRKRALSKLTDLHPEAAMKALQTFCIEEVVHHVYEVPDHLNRRPDPELMAASKVVDVDAVQIDTIPEEGQPDDQPGEDEPLLYGKVRKWDGERGFGFIVQDPEGDVPGRDLFVHRQNVVGSSQASHINLKEGARVSFKVGEKDGRPRAMTVLMVDAEGKALPIHDGKVMVPVGDSASEVSDEDDDEEEITKKFIRHLKHPDIVAMSREKRVQVHSWLRCVGLKRHHNGRRDDVVWRTEIERRIDVFLSRNTTPLQKKDFDYRVRRFLYEICIQSSVRSVSEALAVCEDAVAGKTRDEVRSWSAYLATLLKRYDPKLYESLADRDKRTRIDERNGKQRDSGDVDAEFGSPHDIGVGGDVKDDTSHSDMYSDSYVSTPRSGVGYDSYDEDQLPAGQSAAPASAAPARAFQ